MIKKFFNYRPTFICFGIINIIIFHYAIYRLFMFLYFSSDRLTLDSLPLSLLVNTLLITFFTVPHTLLLHSKVKTKIINYIPKALYSTFYSLHSCIAIILMDLYWADLGGSLYIITGHYKYFFNVLYVLSWLFMLWSMISTGIFRQSGIEEWYLAIKDKMFKKNLSQSGAYSICRHPIYSAFLAMLWTTPNMTYDHLYLTLFWSVYIVWGAGNKERRLIKNNQYKSYAEVTTAFPFIGKNIDIFVKKIVWRIP